MPGKYNLIIRYNYSGLQCRPDNFNTLIGQNFVVCKILREKEIVQLVPLYRYSIGTIANLSHPQTVTPY